MIIIILSILSGLTYMMGGLGDDFAEEYRLPRWMFNRIILRLFVTPMIFCIALLFKIKFSLMPFLITYGLCFGSMTTYGKIGKQKDVYWWNWVITGLLYGLVIIALPYFHLIGWWSFILRTAVLGVTICVWSQIISISWLEMLGRGILLTVTILMLK